MLHMTQDAALAHLIAALKSRSYHFVTPTPASHARVLARSDRQQGRELRDILGWSLAFEPGVLDPELHRLLGAAGVLEDAGDGLLRSTLRASTLKGELFLHAAYPTDAPDAVFFGPDSYRFANLIEAELAVQPMAGGLIVDIGTGTGVGGIVAAKRCGSCELVLTDTNPKALSLARINSEAAGVHAQFLESDTLDAIDRPIALALANPPYIIDDGDRTYRDGGGMLGGQVSLDMARMAVERLAPGGRLILYTGSAIVGGNDPLCAALQQLADEHGMTLRCRELDPDVFGEELEKPAYAQVERIALIAATFTAA
jgi:methylase of polypeptide subunit release factors